MAIPLLLFQTGRRPNASYVDEWQTRSPGLSYAFLDECNATDFLRREYNETFVRAYGSLKSSAVQSDFLSLAFIAKHGGFYIDTDVMPSDVSLMQLSRRAAAAGKDLVYTMHRGLPNLNGPAANISLTVFGAVPNHRSVVAAVDGALERIIARTNSGLQSVAAQSAIAGSSTPECRAWATHTSNALVLHETTSAVDGLGHPVGPDDGGRIRLGGAGYVARLPTRQSTSWVHAEGLVSLQDIYQPPGIVTLPCNGGLRRFAALLEVEKRWTASPTTTSNIAISSSYDSVASAEPLYVEPEPDTIVVAHSIPHMSNKFDILLDIPFAVPPLPQIALAFILLHVVVCSLFAFCACSIYTYRLTYNDNNNMTSRKLGV